jgi:hypothetical protein
MASVAAGIGRRLSVVSAGFGSSNGDRLAFQLIVAFVAFNLLRRAVKFALDFPLWGDEAMVAVNLHQRDLTGLSKPLAFIQLAPPGFLWLSELVTQALGFGEGALRLIAGLAGSAATIAYAAFAWRHLPRSAAVMSTAILCVSMFPMRHSVELKPYAIDQLLATILIWSAWEIHLHAHRDRIARGWVVLFTLTASLGVWVSFPCAIVVGSVGLWLMVTTPRAMVTRMVAVSVPVLACFGLSLLGMLAVYLPVRADVVDEYNAMSMWSDAFPPLSRPWLLPVWLIDVHTGRLMAYPLGEKNLGSIATLVFVCAGIVALLRMHLWYRRFVWLLIAPALGGMLAAALGLYPYGQTARTMLYLAPSIVTLAGVGAVDLLRLTRGRRRRVAWAASLSFLALVGTALLVRDFWKPYKGRIYEQTRATLQALSLDRQPGECWVIPHARIIERGGFDSVHAMARHDGAVLQHYAYVFGPAALHFGQPNAQMLADCSRVVLLIHDDPEDPPVEALTATSRAILDDRLGPPEVRRVPLDKGADLLVYVWEVPSR